MNDNRSSPPCAAAALAKPGGSDGGPNCVMSYCVRSYGEAPDRRIALVEMTHSLLFSIPLPRLVSGNWGSGSEVEGAEKRFLGPSLSVPIRFRCPRFKSPFK